ncbi:MAG: helix-turn-helix transcriptional regulator [Eubacteriales bacterium]|nr:helix-turn-helix transcriptional regulator [Eubacteriales bacterium]
MGVNELVQIGTRIKQLRKEKGLKQKEVADKAQIPYSTFANYENNKREPSQKQIKKIADALGVSEYDLLGVPEHVDITEEKFIKACQWLEDADINIDPPNEDDGIQQYYLHSGFGIDCKLDEIDIIDLVETSIQDANVIRDEIAINHIIRRLFNL